MLWLLRTYNHRIKHTMSEALCGNETFKMFGQYMSDTQCCVKDKIYIQRNDYTPPESK